jgi:D-glycero-D-manno-heptose 1,7-bisphosphate phosphatase
VLLDRDGTIIVDGHYLADPDGVRLLPRALEGLRRLQALGLELVIVSNQSGIGRGLFSRLQLDQVHARLESLLEAGGVTLAGAFYCPHAPDDACDCRKPAIGLASQAAAALGFDLSQTVVVGDKQADVDLGRAIGVPTILVSEGPETCKDRGGPAGADYSVSNLADAAEIIARLKSR